MAKLTNERAQRNGSQQLWQPCRALRPLSFRLPLMPGLLEIERETLGGGLRMWTLAVEMGEAPCKKESTFHYTCFPRCCSNNAEAISPEFCFCWLQSRVAVSVLTPSCVAEVGRTGTLSWEAGLFFLFSLSCFTSWTPSCMSV